MTHDFDFSLSVSCLGWDCLATGYYKLAFSLCSRRVNARRKPVGHLNVFSPNDGDVVASGNETESPFTFPDVPVAKIQGVRAAKSETWLRRPETLSEIVSAILSTEPVFHLSTWFLKQQEDQTWLSEDPTRRPLVNLVTPRFSPVVRAIASCFDMLLAPDSEDGPFAFLRGVLNVLGGGDAGQ